MKLYFDIITNHTADVIHYEEGARRRTVQGRAPLPHARPASRSTIATSRARRVPAAERDDELPLYAGARPGRGEPQGPGVAQRRHALPQPRQHDVHRRELASTATSSASTTCSPSTRRSSHGMIEIYEAWIRDFGVDGFRIDTMKHVDDAFWQRFGPEVLRYARRQGKREFFMFGEVFDTTKSFTSHFTTADRMQAVLDFPFQAAAAGLRRRLGRRPTRCATFFEDDDWYTDADSNAYQLPTFLGNHDMGRIGRFVATANTGASDAELLARDRLAHELMFLSRGNPVIYYGDEQGFTGDGGDQLARQDMFAEPGPRVQRRRPDRDRRDDGRRELRPAAPAVPRDRRAGRRRAALPGAAQRRAAAPLRRPRRRASTRSRASAAAPSASTSWRSTTPRRRTPPRSRPTSTQAGFHRVYGSGPVRLRSDRAKRLTVTVPPLSAVVYALDGRIPRSRRAPSIALARPRRPPRRAAGSRCAPRSAAARSTRSRSSPAPGAAAGGRSAPTTTRPTASSTT